MKVDLYGQHRVHTRFFFVVLWKWGLSRLDSDEMKGRTYENNKNQRVQQENKRHSKTTLKAINNRPIFPRRSRHWDWTHQRRKKRLFGDADKQKVHRYGSMIACCSWIFLFVFVRVQLSFSFSLFGGLSPSPGVCVVQARKYASTSMCPGMWKPSWEDSRTFNIIFYKPSAHQVMRQ